MTKLPPAANGEKSFFKQRLSFLQPLAPIALFYVVGLVIFTGFRIALLLQNFSRVREVEQYLLLFPIGFRIDTMLLCRAIILPAFALLLLPQKIVQRFRTVFSSYFTILAALFVFLEIATFPFMAEFDARLDRIFLEHMAQHEVFGMIFKGFALSLSVGVLAMTVAGWGTFRIFQGLLESPAVCSLKRRMLLCLVAGILLFFGNRSTFIQHAANINLASFSTSNIVNQLALNSSFSLANALYSFTKYEQDPQDVYGKMDPAEVLRRVRKTSAIPDAACTTPDIPLLHYQKSSFTSQQPVNLVIILEESLGAEYVGCMGGLPLTPNIDRLSKEGILFTRLYSTGTRTVRGIEAVISGFPPTPGQSAVKLGLSQKNFFTVAELLRRKGYATEFIYGGRENFDSMSTFFLGNGVETIYDRKCFKRPVFKATWGVSDEDLFGKAHEVFKAHGDKPFFSLILTTSNHDPFEFPDGRIELYEQPKETRNNAVKYTDYALGKFFEIAKKEAYYKNTLFLIIADHSTRLQGQDLIPVHKFHITGLLIGPNVKPGTYDKVASQIDMTPTLLDLMGISTVQPCPGRALFSLPGSLPGRAILQYEDTNAFMENDRVMLQRPGLAPAQFLYAGGRLVPAATDPEFAKNALAHALLPGYLYYNQLHHLPAEAPRK